MDGFKDVKQEFVTYSKFDQEPVKVLKDRCDMVKWGSFSDCTSSWLLDQLKLVEGFLGKAEEERVAVMNMAGDKAVDEDGSLRVEVRAEEINIIEMEICSPGDVVNGIVK